MRREDQFATDPLQAVPRNAAPAEEEVSGYSLRPTAIKWVDVARYNTSSATTGVL